MDKLAEEILDNLPIYEIDKRALVFTYSEAIKAMKSYHEAKLKEITDADIKLWVKSKTKNEAKILKINKIIFEGILKRGIIAVINGEIKHIEK